MIKLQNVDFSYGTEPVLSSFCYEFSAGGFYGVYGVNGCGKSTLLKLITGELKPDSGSVSPVYKTDA